mmetsp:Transcript_19368/g.39821  ORF Transcript_19368/g.39821 Transcript_19368/m.39821 type:complete len:124 (-) Transcript_19368:1942-2313(-)
MGSYHSEQRRHNAAYLKLGYLDRTRKRGYMATHQQTKRTKTTSFAGSAEGSRGSTSRGRERRKRAIIMNRVVVIIIEIGVVCFFEINSLPLLRCSVLLQQQALFLGFVTPVGGMSLRLEYGTG